MAVRIAISSTMWGSSDGIKVLGLDGVAFAAEPPCQLQFIFVKISSCLDVVVHSFNPRPWEAEGKQVSDF